MGLQENAAALFRDLVADAEGFGETATFLLADGTSKALVCVVLRNALASREWEGGKADEERAVLHVSSADDATGIADASTISTVTLADGSVFQVWQPTADQGDGCHLLELIAMAPTDRFQRGRLGR